MTDRKGFFGTGPGRGRRVIPLPTPVENLSEEARKAVFELVSEMLRQESEVLTVTMREARYEERPIGSFEISVRRI